MTPYRNLHGNSSVAFYEAKEDLIVVVFKSGRCRNYLFDAVRPGKVAVERMKSLAAQGYGLNSYISSVVKNNFSSKW